MRIVMQFDQKELENIAKNLKYIRRFLGCKTQADFAHTLDKNAKYPGLSESMIKKYESGKYNISEEMVRIISSLVMFSFNDIVFGDLSYLEEYSLDCGPCSIDDFLFDDTVVAYALETIDTTFPLFSTKKCLCDHNFSKAFDLSKNIIRPTLTEAEEFWKAFENAIKGFEKTNYPESFLNIMSLIGRLYLLIFLNGMGKEAFEQLRSKKYENLVEFLADLHEYSANCSNLDLLKKAKKGFLKAYDSKLSTCMRKVLSNEKYKDYVYYYMAVRYYFGIMDNETTKMSDQVMNFFGISLLDNLKTIGNKYAKKFDKILKNYQSE